MEETYTGTITLKGGSAPESQSHRITVLITLLNNAESKVNHFDNLRQGTLAMALLIFAGSFTFATQAATALAAYLAAASLLLFMTFVLVVDHQFHKYSEGWQATRIEFVRCLQEAINDPAVEVSCPHYLTEAEARATVFSLMPALYLLLTIGGPVSILAASCILPEGKSLWP